MCEIDIICKWLPKLIYLESFDGDWPSYDNSLYRIFKHDFIDNTPTFKGKPVRIRKYPMQGDKEQAYFHVTSVDSSKTSNDPNDRIPDMRRCERILWIRKVIENYDCKENCAGCNGIKVWNKPYKMYQRTHILFQDYKFLVVLEEREDYVLLISSFYIEYGHTLDNKLKEYEKYKAKDA